MMLKVNPETIGALTFYIRGAGLFPRPSQRVFAGELDFFVSPHFYLQLT